MYSMSNLGRLKTLEANAPDALNALIASRFTRGKRGRPGQPIPRSPKWWLSPQPFGREPQSLTALMRSRERNGHPGAW